MNSSLKKIEAGLYVSKDGRFSVEYVADTFRSGKGFWVLKDCDKSGTERSCAGYNTLTEARKAIAAK